MQDHPQIDPNNPLSLAFAQIQGDLMALLAAINALAAVHPNPAEWESALGRELDNLYTHWERFPDASRYQTENRIEQLRTALRSRQHG